MFIEFANFYWRFIQRFSKIAAVLTLMLKASPHPAGVLLATSVDNSEVVGSSRKNDGKLVKSDFTKPICGVEEPSSLNPDIR